MSPAYFPELLAAQACALPIFEISHDALDCLSERKPAVVFVDDLHAHKHGGSVAQCVGSLTQGSGQNVHG